MSQSDTISFVVQLAQDRVTVTWDSFIVLDEAVPNVEQCRREAVARAVEWIEGRWAGKAGYRPVTAPTKIGAR